VAQRQTADHLTPATKDRALAADWFYAASKAPARRVRPKPPDGVIKPASAPGLKIKHASEADFVSRDPLGTRNGPARIGSLPSAL